MDTTSRRHFLRGMGGLGLSLAGGSLLAGCANQLAPSSSTTTGGQLETTRIRLIHGPGICQAPEYVAEGLLRAEGFTEVQYVRIEGAAGRQAVLAAGEADITQHVGMLFIKQADVGPPVVMLAGIHTGCYELFGADHVRSIRDLKDKTVAVTELGSGRHMLLASMLTYVGLDPRTDVNWVTPPTAEAMQLLAEGKVDAFMAFAPEPQELRAKNVGHVVVNTAKDRPWSQYFCCMVAGNREFIRDHPVATKRALRAIMKTADLCDRDPDGIARALVDQGYTPRYDYAVRTLRELPYDKWREYDPEDSVRFFSLRMHEAGIIGSSPNTIIQKGTDWRFLNELKRELKA